VRTFTPSAGACKDGKWGYRPAGLKNWEAVLASKPEDRRKVDRQTRTLYPLTDEVIRLHLSGKKTVGIYPLLLDETCWLLAADFDKATWREDVLAFVATSRRLGVSAYLERSRSGNATCGSFSSARSLPRWPERRDARF
jgi:hypothetical protein